MDSCERFLVPDGYEEEKLKKRRSISVNELFEKKEELAYRLIHDFDSFEMATGVKVKSVKFDWETGLDMQLGI
jgi:hypothetical protein